MKVLVTSYCSVVFVATELNKTCVDCFVIFSRKSLIGKPH